MFTIKNCNEDERWKRSVWHGCPNLNVTSLFFKNSQDEFWEDVNAGAGKSIPILNF